MNKKTKVLFYYMIGGQAGGSDTCLYLLVKFLDRTKYEPFLLFKDRSRFVDELEKLGVTLIPLPIRDRKKKDIQGSSLTKNILVKVPQKNRVILSSIKHLIVRIPDIINLINVIIKFKIDIIHANHYLTGDRAILLASIITRKKIISHNRGLYAPDPIDKIISNHINQIICMSDFSKSVYTDKGVSKEKCKTIYDGIDIQLFNPFKQENEELIIGCFGRLEKWKGQQTLIEAADIIIKEINKIKFIFVGSGPNENILKEQVQKMKLEKYFEFTGHTSNVKEYMNKCTIIVHTSIEPEPFGMVIIEAMALEKPVIATNIGGPLEIIDHEKDGYLIPPQNPIILAENIIELINSPNLRLEIGKNAREKVISKFNVINYVKEIQKVYEDI